MIAGYNNCRWLTFNCLAASALAAILFPCSLLSQQDERSVRTAFVYNLTKYMAWPSSTQALDICVIGKGTTGSDLKTIVDGKLSGQRTIRVQLDPADSDLRHCQIIYLSATAGPRLSAVLDKTRGTSPLTVGESENFLRSGGMIAFIRSGDSLQLEVNLDAVEAANLKISSRLLDLAIIFHPGRRG